MKTLENLVTEFEKLRAIDGIVSLWYVHDLGYNQYIKLSVSYTIESLKDIRAIQKEIREIIGYSYDITYNPMDDNFKITK